MHVCMCVFVAQTLVNNLRGQLDCLVLLIRTKLLCFGGLCIVKLVDESLLYANTSTSSKKHTHTGLILFSMFTILKEQIIDLIIEI